ncbi:hypothetical protein [Bordetella genomosp. 9]|uniref:ACT domain-containing protein n=1 Tax=Bordetella genomosp. 9 TaxID=1416803 RepID=A0A1W6Z2R3_9BORD|nr:hypothetical protein [Bordetella genomosp. 9]ARP87662.1 hypothetical protein CAL13_16710 [Bordetella genomosp. 9]ARP92783.1 hypothetical protein CAL14_16180 [Bordetella genomosp. 9]
MRVFDLFLRRAGVDRAALPDRRHASSRLTVVCPRDALGSVRKRIFSDFKAAGLTVSQLQVEHGDDQRMASACITVKCPAEMRTVLMSQARQLQAHPEIRHVHFGDLRRAAS